LVAPSYEPADNIAFGLHLSMVIALKRWLIIFAAAFFAFPETMPGQSATHWSFYQTADGLPEATYDSLSFTPQGKLMAASSNASFISELDGYSVSNFPAPPGFIGRICESPGGQLWALAPTGLLEYKNGAWLPHSVPEIISQFRPSPTRRESAVPFVPIRQGCVIFLLPEQLIEFSAEDPAHPHTIVLGTAARTGIGQFKGMAISPGGGMWLCGEHGVAKESEPARNLDPETQWQEEVLPQKLQLENLNNPEPDADGGITVLADSTVNHQKVAATFDGQRWTVRPDCPENCFSAWRGPGLTFWAATPKSLFQWDETRKNWVENDEITVGRIFDVEVEPGGAFWLATSDGLIRGSAALWQKSEPDDLNSPVRCLIADSNNRLFFIADNKLYVLENSRHREFPLPASLQNAGSYALFPRFNAPLFVQAGHALFQFEPKDGSFEPFLPGNGRQIIALGYLPGGSLILYAPGTNSYFEELDEGQAYRWKDAPAINDPDAGLAVLFAARNGDLWLGGGRDVLWHHNGQWQPFLSRDQASPEDVAGFAETPEGEIWCAMADELWEFDGKNWLLLQNQFNHINSIKESRDGSIWLAPNSGLFRFCKDAWLANGAEDGLPNGPVNAICEDGRGQIWAATAHGLYAFHPEANPDPPKTFVRRLAGENSRLSEGATLDLLLEGRDKWKFATPARLLYSYQLDQGGWSAFKDVASLSFPDLAAGKHYFQVRAIDPAGHLEATPAKLDFTVIVPWFKEVRLWIVLVLGLGAAIFFAAVAWNRHRQLVLSHAAVERKVEERTRELETAMRELLQSQKMNALGTLAAGIAHDFNNILSIVKGSAQIIEDNTGQPEKIRTRVARIKTVVQQGAEIVDAMLGFSRASDTFPAPCDINAVVADTVKLLGDRFLRETEVKLQRAAEVPQIFAPREFIQQILLNFIFNAAEAMAGPKKITLATGVTDKLPPDIFLAPASSASFVLISVSDRGSGIAPEIMSRIFEPFFTTKALSTRRGAGLGLSMVYELAKKMNAGLAVHSVAGQGSTFTLILPVPNRPPGKASPETSE
jgi:signal transduction histidine kinase